MTGASDGHFNFDIAQGYTEFEGTLRDALKNKTTKTGGSEIFGLFSGLFAFINKRILTKLGIKKCPYPH